MKRWIAVLSVGAMVSGTLPVLEARGATPGGPAATLAEPVLVEPRLADPILAQIGTAANAKPDAGGLTPCLLTCYLGPRVGAEHNEGRGIATIEWVSLLFFPARIVPALEAYKGQTISEWARENAIDSRPIEPPKSPPAAKGGVGSCLIAICLGPRVAFERNEGRALRTREILLFVPVVNLVAAVLMGLESYNGKTMSQIARDEGLDAPTP